MAEADAGPARGVAARLTSRNLVALLHFHHSGDDGGGGRHLPTQTQTERHGLNGTAAAAHPRQLQQWA